VSSRARTPLLTAAVGVGAQEVRPTNFFVLSGATVQTSSKNGFDIIFSNGERRSMQAFTEEERDAWVLALRETIRRQAQKKLEALQVRIPR
jgi:hypothetical protein